MTIGRARYTLTFLANLMLVVGMNPCPWQPPKSRTQNDQGTHVHPQSG